KRQFVYNLCAEFPTGGYENWARCQMLFPHAKPAAGQQPEGDSVLGDWTTMLYRAAWYAWGMENGIEAEKMSVQAMNARKKMFGPEHEEMLDSKTMVGLAYNLKGRWEATEALKVEVMETYKKLGADHPSTLTSMGNLVLTYGKQGRWKAAEALEVEVMEIRKKKLGADHPDTLTSMNNLAFTWNRQGRDAEAIKLMRDCVQLRRHVLGVSHPHYISASKTMAT
ncbi:putative nephrocystin, partial [Cenococcum geophilum 1.58]|uniref:putative nephrocystin n=1 Tax=Cenococcum geophilum 1.58 TaxID=794803 RepID=UPI00358E8494